MSAVARDIESPRTSNGEKAFTPQIVRDRIKLSAIVGRLERHVLGRSKMSSTQLNAAKILLNKVLPDLQAIEFRGDIELNVVHSEPVSSSDWLGKHGRVIDGEAVPAEPETGQQSIAIEAGDWFKVASGATVRE